MQGCLWKNVAVHCRNQTYLIRNTSFLSTKATSLWMNPWWDFLKEWASVSSVCSAPLKTAAMFWGSCTSGSITYSLFPIAGWQHSYLLSRHLHSFSWEFRANGDIENILESSDCAVETQLRGTSEYKDLSANTACGMYTVVIVVHVESNIKIF